LDPKDYRCYVRCVPVGLHQLRGGDVLGVVDLPRAPEFGAVRSEGFPRDRGALLGRIAHPRCRAPPARLGLVSAWKPRRLAVSSHPRPHIRDGGKCGSSRRRPSTKTWNHHGLSVGWGVGRDQQSGTGFDVVDVGRHPVPPLLVATTQSLGFSRPPIPQFARFAIRPEVG
jgi:hypothetical protein